MQTGGEEIIAVESLSPASAPESRTALNNYAHSTPEEDKAVEALRTAFPDSEQVKAMSHLELLRYVRSRSTLAEATTSLRNGIAWRAETQPEKVIQCRSSFEAPLKSGMTFWHKHDKLGRPCMVVTANLHIPAETTVETTLKLCIYFLEQARERCDGRNGGPLQYTVIYDMKGFSFMKNLDTGALSTLSKLQEAYPELLGAAYIINAPWLVSTLMKLLNALMTKQTMDKVRVLSGDGIEELRQYFDVDCLLPQHGGTSDYKFSYDGDKDNHEGGDGKTE